MKILLLAVAFSISVSTFSQTRQGSVVYEVRVKNNFGPAAQSSEIYSQTYELIFTEKESIYAHLPEKEAENQNGEATIVQPQNYSVTYFDFVSGNKVEQRKLQNDTYLIKEPFKKLNWIITKEEKNILGQKVFKAYCNRQDSALRATMVNGELKKETFVETVNIEAWFAPGIPVSAGPAEFQGQLPGLVLEIRFDNDRKVYLAKEISPKVNSSLLKEPNNGKFVRMNEYFKIMERQMSTSQQLMKAQQN